MGLIAFYVVFLAIGEGIAYGIGRAVEHWSVGISMPVFLGLFFVMFWAAWQLAVKFSAPKS